MTSADNQQGRPDGGTCPYVVGFVDGEGSFHVAVQRNPSTKLKWQVIPELHVSQNESNKGVLELIRDVLGCGYLKPNHPSNPKDKTYVVVVRNRETVGFIEILKIAFTRNVNGTRRKLKLASMLSLLEPSETVRRTPEKSG